MKKQIFLILNIVVLAYTQQLVGAAYCPDDKQTLNGDPGLVLHRFEALPDGIGFRIFFQLDGKEHTADYHNSIPEGIPEGLFPLSIPEDLFTPMHAMFLTNLVSNEKIRARRLLENLSILEHLCRFEGGFLYDIGMPADDIGVTRLVGAIVSGLQLLIQDKKSNGGSLRLTFENKVSNRELIKSSFDSDLDYLRSLADHAVSLSILAVCRVNNTAISSEVYQFQRKSRYNFLRVIIDSLPLFTPYRNTGSSSEGEGTFIELLAKVTRGEVIGKDAHYLLFNPGVKEPLPPDIAQFAFEQDKDRFESFKNSDNLGSIFNDPNVVGELALFHGSRQKWDLEGNRLRWEAAESDEGRSQGGPVD